MGKFSDLFSCLVKFPWFQCGTCHGKYVKVPWYISFPKCLAYKQGEVQGFKWPLVLGRFPHVEHEEMDHLQKTYWICAFAVADLSLEDFQKTVTKGWIGDGGKHFLHFQPENWGRFPFWLIFFKGVETTSSIGTCILFSLEDFFWGILVMSHKQLEFHSWGLSLIVFCARNNTFLFVTSWAWCHMETDAFDIRHLS